ncbi:MAG TPA: LuxR family transcriptional regulator [Blastocatellia bacterium]|nr:LuxR family transcriptional regulator [Blastocatellia bacterium]
MGERTEIHAAVIAAASGLFVVHPDVLLSVLPDVLELSSSLSNSTPGPKMPSAPNTPHSGGQQLSPREAEVLNLLAAGMGNKQIAGLLKISEHTVKFHITSIFNKLGASSRAEAVAIGVRRGSIIL